MQYRRSIAAVIIAGGLLVGSAAPTLAWNDEPPAKCNSGRGNASETLPDNDCDPGNSAGHNDGGG